MGMRVVEAYLNGAADKDMSIILQGLASDIDRGLEHLRRIQNAEGAIPCAPISDVFLPEIAALVANPKSLYFAWDAAP